MLRISLVMKKFNQQLKITPILEFEIFYSTLLLSNFILIIHFSRCQTWWAKQQRWAPPKWRTWWRTTCTRSTATRCCRRRTCPVPATVWSRTWTWWCSPGLISMHIVPRELQTHNKSTHSTAPHPEKCQSKHTRGRVSSLYETKNGTTAPNVLLLSR